jgi:hypothetical protein
LRQGSSECARKRNEDEGGFHRGNPMDARKDSQLIQMTPQSAPKKCTAFVLPTCDLSDFQRFLRKLVTEVKTRVSIDFSCILVKIE